MKEILSYSTLNTQDDTVSDSGSSNNNGNNDNSSSPDMSAAASPYWQVPFQSPTAAGFSPFVAFCFTINYILGTGFLTIPWAFVQSGLVLSTILMILSAVASDIAKDFLLETMARAEAMLDDQMHWIEHGNHKKSKQETQQHPKARLMLPPTSKEERDRQLRAIRQKQQQQEEFSDDDEEEGLVSYQRESYHAVQTPSHKRQGSDKFRRSASAPMEQDGNNTAATRDHHQHHVHFNQPTDTEQQAILVYHKQDLPPTKYLIEQRKFEVNALCRVFLGKVGLQVYTLIICLYLCGALWAYTSVFSSAMATAVPLFGDDQYFNYTCYAILYGCVVVPLSCLELDEQVPLQVFLTLCRFLMFFLMIGTSYLAADDEKDVSNIDSFEPAANFQWSGIAKTLPILVFANIFHHSIPGLTHPVGDKRKVGKVFTATNIFTVAAYVTLGLTLGAAFGTGIEQSSNLNWSTFHAGTGYIDEDGDVVDAAWWTKVISKYIMLFPAVDVVSAYPLNAITLGNNIFGAAYGKRIHEVEKDRFKRTCFRLLASVPPIIFGILVRELGTITDYTGTSGFLIGLCFPSVLYICSRNLAKEHNFSLETFYTNYGSSVRVAKFIFWFGIFMMIFVFTKLTFFS
jgi:amino acid permease